MTDRISKEHRSWNMSRIRSTNTLPERIVRSLLHKHGFRFRLHVKKLPGKPDIVLPKYKTVIFVHGCFWHQHRACKQAKIPQHRHDWWAAKLANNVRRDAEQIASLNSLGWKVLVVWSCALKAPPQKKSEEISRQIISALLNFKINNDFFAEIPNFNFRLPEALKAGASLAHTI